MFAGELFFEGDILEIQVDCPHSQRGSIRAFTRKFANAIDTSPGVDWWPQATCKSNDINLDFEPV